MKAKHYSISGHDLVTVARHARLREQQPPTQASWGEWAIAAVVIAGTALVMWAASQTAVHLVTAWFARVLP